MKIFVAHASAFQYEQKLYAPIRSSVLGAEHEFVLPEERKYHGTWNTKEAIRECQLFIVDASVASTGAGIELGWADAAGIPIIAIYEKGSVPSVVLSYVTDTVVEYENADDMLTKLEAAISALSKG